MDLFDSSGVRIAIDKELFRGGEGTIHPVIGSSALLAKLYHHNIDTQKQAKLSAMATTSTDALLRVAAWPAGTLHDRRGGRMVGFLMPRFDGQRSELHQLYRPGTRKQTFRQADWAFLIHAARNVAAAVATVHAAGHVVGDVNQRNFIVGGDATVKVLDCDSFQIRANGHLFHCPVGVPEFTPPELQNRPLDSVERTPNHDAFGLAVLVFQLLFMGRHPFAGRFLGTGDMPIERAIAEGRFAFGKGSRSRQMEPPPNLLPLESLPPRLSALFETAFGGGSARPGAKEWCDALAAANTELRECPAERMHKYYKALPACLWCVLERSSGVYFFIGVATGPLSAFDLAQMWKELVAATGLPYEAPTRPAFSVVAAPIPPELRVRRRNVLLAKIAGGLLLAGIAIVSPGSVMIMLASIVAVIAILPLPGAGERKRRLERFREAERAWNEAYRAAERALSVEPLLQKGAEMQRVKAAYEKIEADRQNELGIMTRNARQLQLLHYLQQQSILTSAIPDVGPKRKRTLAAWGIDTAADVTWQALARVQGFGPALQARLMAWRASIESSFVFDPKRAIPQHELDAFEYRWRRMRTDLEQQLRAGLGEARRMNQAIRERRQTIAKELETPSREWVQANADLELIRRELSYKRAG